MTALHFPRVAIVAIAITLLAAACSSPEDTLRSDLLAEGMSETSADCIVASFEDAGVDIDELEDMESAEDFPIEAAVAMSACIDGIFNDMFSEGFEELEADMSEAFDDLESDFNSEDAIAFSDSADVDLDALVASCEAGDNVACDDLWLHSSMDSVEEQIAESCGGRSVEQRMGSCEFWLD